MGKRITLVCSAGMSTSLLVTKMKAAADAQGLELCISAVAEGSFGGGREKETDILLLGPQISYRLKVLKQEYEPMGIKVAVIDTVDYGMMNGEKVLKDALSL
jgi:PTS system cellobiose-specific IIB component